MHMKHVSVLLLFSFNELENMLHCYLDKLYWHNPEVRLKGHFCWPYHSPPSYSKRVMKYQANIIWIKSVNTITIGSSWAWIFGN